MSAERPESQVSAASAASPPVAMQVQDVEGLEEAKPLKSRFEDPVALFFSRALALGACLTLVLIFVRKTYQLNTLKPLGTSLQVNMSRFPDSGLNGREDDFDDLDNIQDYELVEQDPTAEDFINFGVTVMAALVIPSIGINAYRKEDEGLVSTYFYFSIIAGCYVGLTTTYYILGDYYDDPRTSFPDCFPGDDCFSKFLLLEYAFIFSLLFGAWTSNKLKSNLEHMNEEINAMEDADAVESAELAETQVEVASINSSPSTRSRRSRGEGGRVSL